MKIKYIITFSIQILLFFCITSCKKFVDIEPPPTTLIPASVYNNDATAIAALSSIYTKFASNQTSSFSLYPGYSADEFLNTSTNTNNVQFYTNGLLSTTGTVATLWNGAYTYIYQANAVLDGLQKYTGVSAAVRAQLTGEAKFIRAFLHYYLVSLYGDIPLILTTDYTVNALAGRMPKSDVYKQILADLKDAESLLSTSYLAGDLVSLTTEKLRPTKAAARALLARVYLYLNDWASAESYASAVINTGTFSLITSDLTTIWAKNSAEAIWQISTNPAFNTFEGNNFIATSTPQYAGLSNSLLNAFEPNDKRRLNWVGTVTAAGTTYYFPYKYRVQNSTTVSEYVMIFRYAELFLLRAEAYANQNKLTQAITDLNSIRSRAGLPALSPTLSQAQVLSAIEQEHRIELFSEWGDRWLFLKRTGRIDAVMSVATPLKGNNSWNTNYQLYPIPQTELAADPNLTQNPGY
ncbi:MAG: RagB/SusD family nutrient uptake outer membrane protein [Sphingobacteriia bacterium]|nr:RagB/SusD family nutrient uptake outer membrane protein [Sphingobacteriia bacterium]